MDFKHIYTSSKTYIVLLFIAITLLLVTTSMTYRQIMLSHKSGEMVVNTLQVYNSISDLTTHYTKAESEEFRQDLINDTTSNKILESYKLEGRGIIDTLSLLTQDNDLHAARIKPLRALLNNLYSQLEYSNLLSYQASDEKLLTSQSYRLKINKTLSEIKSIKNRLLEDEKRLMQKRKVTYVSHKSLTPTMLLILAFFALLVFIISFFRIYNNKLKIRKSETFLKNVLATTDNIVNYYEPIFNEANEIIDFEIIYANDCNRDYLGIEPNDILGSTVLNVYPLHKTQKELEELVESFKEKTKVIFDRKIDVEGKVMWFHSLVTPLAEGVLVTCRNSTPEEEAKEVEQTLKKRLENQNLKLLDNRALLTNIFKSISHIVMHFKSIRGKNGEIIDFEILFVNDKISPVTGNLPEDVRNKKLSEIFPNTFKSGVFEQLVNAVENDRPVEYEVPHNKKGTVQWFHATAIKLGDGVTVTTRDVTEEKEKEDRILRINEELLTQNTIFNDAEKVAEIGSYIWYLDTGEATISQNFYRILGYGPDAFKVTFDSYRGFVHPEDLEMYDQLGRETAEIGFSKIEGYRIITKEGETIHLRLKGQKMIKEGRLVSAGVVQNVTQTIKAEEMLLKSNIELKNRNAELESFNRVASHDLQEPLRKIQLFTLRIHDTEAENFSGKSKEYFSRVINAVNRMQSLIENLLAYSRINISKSDYEKVDLNHVLDKIKEELVTSINNYKIEIISDELPVIIGVSFQMEQLFTNLIANAIKYKSTNKSPEIKIHYSKVSASEILNQDIKGRRQYHKISFVDNGIGFKQEYAEKIFEVFQRLHQKTEYSGTGIGLAICKKIVENHNGYIYAVGTEDVGAEFIVYIPIQQN